MDVRAAPVAHECWEMEGGRERVYDGSLRWASLALKIDAPPAIVIRDRAGAYRHRSSDEGGKPLTVIMSLPAAQLR